MAVDLQTITAAGQFRPLVTLHASTEERNRTSEPFATFIHTADSATFDGSGVGDNVALRIEFPLPANYGYRLSRMIVQVFSPQWGNYPHMEIYVAMAPDIAPGLTTQLQMPVDAQEFGDVTGASVGTTWSYSPWAQSPTAPLYYGYADGGSPPTFVTADNATDVDASTLSYWVEHQVFSLEQTNNAALHWPQLTTITG